MAVALKSNAIITLLELDEFLRNTIGDEDLSHTLINMASDFIDRFCNRQILQATHTDEEHDGNNSNQIYINNYPIVSVTHIKSYDSNSAVDLHTYTVNTEYLIYKKEGYIYMRGRTSPGHKNYRITYVGGYLIADVPYDLKSACAKLAGLVYYGKGKTGATSETIGKYSISYNKLISASIAGIPVPAEIAGIIFQYRNINI